jgi:hypothetical protein
MISKQISLITGKYWYLPFIKEEIKIILFSSRPDKKKAYDEITYWIQKDLHRYLIHEIPTLQDEVDSMINFLEEKLQQRVFSYTEIDNVSSEFSNLRALRNKTKNPSLDFTLNMKRKIVKFYALRYIRVL